MTSKKESEQDYQAAVEAKIAQCHKRFAAIKLVPDEFSQREELPISPALHFDEADDEPMPAPTPPASNRPMAKKPEQPAKPIEKPKEVPPEPKKRDLGAAGMLLSGTLGPEKKSAAEPESKVEQKKKESRTPKKSKAETQLGTDHSEAKSAPIDIQPPVPATVASKPVPEVPVSKPDDTSHEEEGSNGGKSSVFARAKSLFANITKKDKK